MTVELPRPPEPSTERLRSQVSTEEMERLYEQGDDEIVIRWLVQTAVPAYLWKHWKESLKAHGITWPDFQSETRFANLTIELWESGRRDWDDVLEAHADYLDATLGGAD